MKRILTVTLFTAGIAVAQSNRGLIGVPWLGWVFDSEAKAARPITGLAMSAMLGAKTDVPLSMAVGSPEGSFALGVAAESGKVLVVRGAGVTELAGARVSPSRSVMSVRGTVAALYFEEGNTVQIFDGLPGAARLARELTIDATPVALAVDDSGSTVLASGADGLFSYKAEQGKQLVISGAAVAEAGFIGVGGDLVAVNDGKVMLMRGGQISELSQDDGVVDAVKASVSADGRSLVVLSKRGGILVRDLVSGASRTLSCYCTASELSRLHGNSVFRLNGLEDGAVWLVNGDEDEPKVTFVAMRGEN